MLALPAVLGVTAVGAVAVYDHLTGRRFVPDLAYRLQLARRPLAAWARHFEDNPRVAPVTVCLTTTPSRIAHLAPTLASLFAQHVRPQQIRLHVPHHSRREACDYTIPPWLPALPVRIVRCEDHGPATKLLPALDPAAPDDLLLVVDDDKLYPRTLVGALSAAAQREPGVAWGSSGWRVPDDLTDRPTTLLRNLLHRPPAPVKCTRIREPYDVDILQGYSGYVVRPRFFDLRALRDTAHAPPEAFTVDDVWISAHCRVPKRVLPQPRYNLEPWSKRTIHRPTSLGLLNRAEGDLERRPNTVMIRYFRDVWRTPRVPWSVDR